MTSSSSPPPTLEGMQAILDGMNSDLNTFWLLFGAILVFFMQTGFAMLEVGSVSIKNTKNILIKNIGDASIGAVCWWLLGYGVAFGTSSGRFIGTDDFALKGANFDVTGDEDWGYNNAFWLFQWAFAATAATIVSGAVAERVSFNAYIIYSIVLTSFIYPVVVHWGWSAEGWASAFAPVDDLLFECGVIDFAGSGVVHMTGGLAALCAAFVVGPRTGRFNEDGTANSMPQQSAVLQSLGTLILWLGWYGFNGVSTLAILGGASGIAAKTMVTTTISAAFGALTTVLLGKLNLHYWDGGAANNGLLAGLVGVTAGCSTCEPEGAMVIGIVSGFVYTYSSKLLVMLKIDDVVDAIPVHCFCGMWGVFAASLFATEDNYALAYYGEPSKCKGAFYGGDGSAVGANLVFILAVVAWTCGTCMALFMTIKMTVGMRVDKEMEQIGMDDSKHGGQTYPEMVKGTSTA